MPALPGTVIDREIATLQEELKNGRVPCGAERDARRTFWALQTIDGGRPAVRVLVEEFKRGPGVLTVWFLFQLGPCAEESVPDMVDLLRTAWKYPAEREKRDFRTEDVCCILGAIGPKAHRAVPLLGLYVDNEREERVRLAATFAFHQLGGNALAVERALTFLSTSADPSIRRGAVLGIGRICALSPALERTLTAALGDSDPPVRIAACRGLWKLGQRAADRCLAVLTDVLGLPCGPNYNHEEALRLLGEMGPTAAAAVPAIRRLGQRKGEDILDHDITPIALIKIQGRSADLDRELTAILKEQPYFVRTRFVAFTLFDLKGTVRDATVQAFARIVAGDDKFIDADTLFDELRNLSPQAAPLVPLLTTMLRDKDSFHSQIAARALGQIGPPASSAINELRELARRDDVHLRLQALDAIRKIQGAQQPSR